MCLATGLPYPPPPQVALESPRVVTESEARCPQPTEAGIVWGMGGRWETPKQGSPTQIYTFTAGFWVRLAALEANRDT